MLLQEKTVANFVTENYKAADVFKKYNIDFCCGGNVPLNSICTQKDINLTELVAELEKIMEANKPTEDIDYASWSLEKLAKHILETHHVYIKESAPTLEAYLLKLRRVHGERHPELLKVQEIFSNLALELSNHLMKEENILFPYILKLCTMEKEGKKEVLNKMASVKNPISCMMMEHETAGEEIKEINDLTNNYTIPDDACNTYRVAFKKLEEFQNDLFMHVHLENNILFPKAIELEAKLFK